MSTLRDREYRCQRCPEVSIGISAMTTHALTHGKEVTSSPSPMWFYVTPDGEVVGEFLDLEAALAARGDFPHALPMHHLALKRKARRERNSGASRGPGGGE